MFQGHGNEILLDKMHKHIFKYGNYLHVLHENYSFKKNYFINIDIIFSHTAVLNSLRKAIWYLNIISKFLINNLSNVLPYIILIKFAKTY